MFDKNLKCRHCGSRGVSNLGSVAPTHPGKFHTRDFALHHCPGCDVVYLDPLPTAADLRVLYEESKQFASPHYTDPVQVEKILRYYDTSIRNLDLLPRDGGSALEIGAGLAWVSRACKTLAPGVRTVAQDVTSECAAIAPWVDRYFVGTLDELPERGPYELVSMTHVIEHLADPAGMLQRVGALLAPGGKLFVTAPYRPSRWRAELGIAPWRDYSYLHVPAHITYFSRAWFERHATENDLAITRWDSSHEQGQAFELVLRRN